MNSKTPFEDEVLARALRGQVDGMTQAPLTFDDIAGRAGRIRRRRRAAAAAGVAATVAAIALPASLMSSGVIDRSDSGQVATQAPSPTAAADLGPVTATLDFSITGLPNGDPPRVGWVEDGIAYLPDGTDVVLPSSRGETVRSAAALGDNLVLSTWDDQGNVTVVVTNRDGEILSSDPAAGSPVLSEDGTVAAYARPDGTPVLLTNGGLGLRELPQAPAESPMVAAVTGSAPCDEACAVWVNDVGREAASYRVDASGATEVATTTRVGAVLGDRYLGNVGIKDDLFPVDGLFAGDTAEPAWTVETALTGFSPDGSWVVGQFSEGLGPTELRILDAETGKPQVTWLRSGPEGATALGAPVWEDDTHLLQVLTQGRDVVIVRFGLDGSMELTGVRQTLDDPTLSSLTLMDG